MVCRREIVELPRAGPGTRRSIVVQRFGEPGARPKAYLHAALHAQELPGIVVLDHLAGMLRDADVTGEVVIVPFANPIGLAQQVMMETPGRHDLDTGRNYNRGFPDILDEVVRSITGRLGRSHDANVARVRRAALDVLERRNVLREDDVLKTTLLRLSLDSDYVLDLHTAWEALPHMFVSSPHWPDAGDLARDMESEVVIVDDGNPMMTFKSAHVLFWQGIARHFPASLERPGCLAAVLELRGQRDVDDHLTLPAARGLLRWLRRRGVVGGEPGPLPGPRCQARSIAGLRRLQAPAGGIVVYAGALGRHVARGETFAHILDPASGTRHPVTAPVAGCLYTRRSHRLVRQGDYFCAIAGDDPPAE